ncbi:hypothetical protein CBR_g47161 [Chara braunii]|uniref:PA domain-containing protein n=1 Tax=Chara braunii TaxID=69332 RepID=A0A388M1M8_CHABU|nr:hypothetical protein CBR_g47161 [Chara braunii]|eukprot:GBG88464.1 hypothetical protein CBR_g47161 [Chara braunii]
MANLRTKVFSRSPWSCWAIATTLLVIATWARLSDAERAECDVSVQLVSIQIWRGEDDSSRPSSKIMGIASCYGSKVEKQPNASKLPLVAIEPFNACNESNQQLGGHIVLAMRGGCNFAEKTLNAQRAGAQALVIVDNTGGKLFPMNGKNGSDSDLGITIASVLISKKDGMSLKSSLDGGGAAVKMFESKPALVDPAEIILWSIAVTTVVLASMWSAARDRKAYHGYGKIKPQEENPQQEGNKGQVFEINMTSAVMFIVMASVMLLVLFYFMSKSFYIFLVVLLCFGGFEGLQLCFHGILQSWLPDKSQLGFEVPWIGWVPLFWLMTAPLSAGIAVVWAVYRQSSLAWVGQDILGISLMLSVLQTIRLPNIKVSTLLLSLAFFYDIFWVVVVM